MPVKNSKAATLLTLAQAAACLLFRRDTVSRVGARDTLDEKRKKKKKSDGGVRREPSAVPGRERSGLDVTDPTGPKPHRRRTNMCVRQ